ncbi:UNVERIFIED_CONTAM: Proline-rich protein 4 [Sesamum latifolium]|uniref:Proline-rich protein 4 n=1 Tax=Sesamum latifolium TaxID=2727402 RepID=A0AAW2XIW6_9LAMI
MRVQYSLSRRGFFLLSLLLLAVSFCSGDDKTFEVVGTGECADCKENNFKTSHAVSGLHVTIDCKLPTGEIKRVGDGDLDEEGKFKVSLPHEIIEDEQKLKHECYAQLHSAAAVPCPAHKGLDASKIVFKGKTTFGPAKNLQFSTALCTSKFLWPYFKYPPLPKTHPWKKKFPKINFPPLKNFGHPWLHHPFPPLYKPKPLPPPIPIYKPPVVKPLPPPVPIYKPPVIKPLPPPVPIYKPKPKPPVVVKPLPPPVPIYKPKPKPPIVKPLPPPVPIYKPKPKPPVVKPLPPPVPIYKPKPKPPVVKPLPPPIPIYKPKPKPPVVIKPLPPPVPIYKPPVVTKPLPPPIPLYPIPPFFHKKPCPPLPKLPPFPKIPPKYFHHPKFGFPPLPPSIPHP